VKRLANCFAFVARLSATVAASDEMDANTLLQIYDSAPPKEKLAIEQTVLTAEAAFREASSTIVLQRNEYGLYCPPLKASVAQKFSPNDLIEMIRHEVNKAPFLGKHNFEISLLHALQVAFPCPSQ
jgi:hypothetical protein